MQLAGRLRQSQAERLLMERRVWPDPEQKITPQSFFAATMEAVDRLLNIEHDINAIRARLDTLYHHGLLRDEIAPYLKPETKD